MQIIKWIAGVVLYYVIVHFGVNLYIPLLEKLYVEPIWLYLILLLVLNIIAVNIVGRVAYIIARLVIYGSISYYKEYVYLITLPWLVWNLIFLIGSIINKISGDMPSIYFIGNIINSGCWIYLLGAYIVGSLVRNKAYDISD